MIRHKLRFEVRAETMALFRDAQAALRAELGGEVDDDTLLYEIARVPSAAQATSLRSVLSRVQGRPQPEPSAAWKELEDERERIKGWLDGDGSMEEADCATTCREGCPIRTTASTTRPLAMVPMTCRGGTRAAWGDTAHESP